MFEFESAALFRFENKFQKTIDMSAIKTFSLVEIFRTNSFKSSKILVYTLLSALKM